MSRINKREPVYVNFYSMNQENYSNPSRSRKQTLDFSSDLRSKYSTVESRLSKDSKQLRESHHWADHEKRRDNRISSLLKVRKTKLEEITGENRKIYIRISEQHSHYPSSGPQQSEKATIKYKDQPNVLGPIGNWQPPSCFIAGSKGIMCEPSFGFDNILLKPERKRLPSLTKIGTPDRQKQNIYEEPLQKHLGSVFLTPNRSRNISDLYMLI